MPPFMTGQSHNVLFSIRSIRQVRSFVDKLVNAIFWKWMNQFWCKLA